MNWAVVAGLVALSSLLLFRTQLAAILGRTRGLRIGPIKLTTGGGAIQTHEQLEPQSGEELLRTFDSPMLLEQEDVIKKEIAARGLKDNTAIVRVLIRHLAATQIALLFNQIDTMIFGSQLAFLRFLNVSPQGATEDQAKVFYDRAAVDAAEAYKSISFVSWLGFIRSWALLLDKDGAIWITQRGREFLSFLTNQGRDFGGRVL